MARPWMPFYVADYLADTGDLTTLEHGAYLLLIMHYWQRGSLPDDNKKLASIARASLEQWSDIRPSIEGFFDPGWRHARIDEELEKSRKAYEKRAAAGRAGGKAKASNQQSSSNARTLPEHSSTNHNHNHIDSYTASQHSYGGAAPIDVRMPDLLAALGITDETKTPGLIAISEPLRWIEGGCDIDADIIPTLREMAAKGKQPRSWAYCSEAIFEARDRRLKPTPEPRARAPASAGRRMNAVEANLARRIRKNERQGERRSDSNVELLPPDGTGLRSLVGDLGTAMRWPDGSSGD